MSLLPYVAHYWSAQILPLSLEIAILVTLICALTLVLRRVPAQYRYLLWLVVLIRLCIPIAFVSPFGLGQYPEHIFRAGLLKIKTQTAGNRAQDPAAINNDANRLAAIPVPIEPESKTSAVVREHVSEGCLLWLSGVLVLLVLVAVRMTQARRSTRICACVERPELIGLAQRLAREAGLSRPVRLLESKDPRLPIPSIHGVLRPAIVLPADMAHTWALESIEPVLLHELAHIKRRDSLVNSAQITLQVLYFFHPMVWIANWAVRRERELACDDEVVRRLRGRSHGYVRSMLMVAETAVRQPRPQLLGIAMAENSSNLGRRIRRMMHPAYKGTERYGLNFVFIILVAGVLCVAVSAQGPAPAAARPDNNHQPTPAAVAAPAPGNPTNQNKDLDPKVPEAAVQEYKGYAVLGGTPADAPRRQGPIRVSNAILETRLLQRVDPVMPREAVDTGMAGMVMLEIVINETGQLASFRVLLGAPLFETAAINAVRQWRYEPTSINGEPVSVVGNVVLGFGVPDSITIGQNGVIKGPDGSPVSFAGIRSFQGTLVTTPESGIAFETLDRAIKSMQAYGVQHVQLTSGDFVFNSGKLFYLGPTLVGGVTGGIQSGILGGVAGGVQGGVAGGVSGGIRGGILGGAPGGVVGGIAPRRVAAGGAAVQAPELDIDTTALSAKAKASAAALPRATDQANFVVYRLFVNETGEIVSVSKIAGMAVPDVSFMTQRGENISVSRASVPDLPDIEAALARTRVLSPGRRGDNPVPVAITIMLSIR